MIFQLFLKNSKAAGKFILCLGLSSNSINTKRAEDLHDTGASSTGNLAFSDTGFKID